MTPPWKNVLVEVPGDGVTVWIVRLAYFDTPIQATWSETNQRFDYVDSNAGAAQVPVWQVFKWRPL